MSTGRHIDKICIAVVCLTLVITVLFMCGGNLGLSVTVKAMKYENTLFDTSYVHRIDIVMDDWDSFIENCESEEYSSCTVVIDGSSHKNTAIRAKGNTSLSSVRSMGSQRYSFKLEFDHYESGKSCDGLDKLCLNNLIQDNTMMKDYIVYSLMNDFGVESPLCSFAYITVNGEEWGLYLAVEGIEDSFLTRNYGSGTGELYKPDSMSFGGGRGNGKGFNMDDFEFDFGGKNFNFGDNNVKDKVKPGGTTDNTDTEKTEPEDDTGVSDKENRENVSRPDANSERPKMPDGAMPYFDGEIPEGMPPESGGGIPPDIDGEMPGMPNSEMVGPPDGKTPDFNGEIPGNMPSNRNGGSRSGSSEDGGQEEQSLPANNFSDETNPGFAKGFLGEKGGFGGGMGNDDVKLKYIDDDPDSYPDIFDNAKTDISESDEKRLIKSLKSLSEYEDLEDVLDIEEVLRYFVVHNFVCNGDSYTGSMIHNYYLHEKDGKLGMIPWDYNLAFGTFQGGNASGSVNADIDSPVSGGDSDDRPMLGWIFSDESYTEKYHDLFGKFIEKWNTGGELENMISDTADMIRPYVEKDPTKFCTTEDFEKGVSALSQFVSLRLQAVERQLNGNDTAVETDSLKLSDMGTMGGGMGGNTAGMPDGKMPDSDGDMPGMASEKTEIKDSDVSGQNGGSQRPQIYGDISEPESNGKSDTQNNGVLPGKNIGNRQMPGGDTRPIQRMDDIPGVQSKSSGAFWVMTGISAGVLLAGLFIAVKKKTL